MCPPSAIMRKRLRRLLYLLLVLVILYEAPEIPLFEPTKPTGFAP